MASFETLTLEEVKNIHWSLVHMFEREADPISPAGERPGGMLESAVARQHIGLDGSLRFADPIANGASLAYGLCKNHPFHNGNKRTALVSLLVHLDKNKLIFKPQVDHRAVYEFITAMASDTLHCLPTRLGFAPDAYTLSEDSKLTYDQALQYAIAWVRARVRTFHRGDRPIAMRELKRILASYGYDLSDPNNNFSNIFKNEEITERKWLGFAVKRSNVRKKVFQIACSGMNQTVQISTIKEVRRKCNLREEDGVDSDSFYGTQDRVDHFLNEYRNILKRLSRA
ncbi:MAG: type II toxin-antitoxin system death-on-curing family toxin [Phycisphaerales bacterium]